MLSQCIPCVDQVLRAGFRHSTGIQTMLKLIKKAAEESYHPKGFDEKEDLQALLFLCLGGTQVADIAHHIFWMPVVTMIRRHTIVPQILPSPSFLTSHKIEYNIATTFKPVCNILKTSLQKILHAVIMFDKISVESHLYWDDKSNKILGVCCKCCEWYSHPLVSVTNP